MKQHFFLPCFLFFIAANPSAAQLYDILIKGGRLIDAKNNINTVMDIAVKNGKIAAVAKHIDAKEAKQVIDAVNKYVVPGLIDIHAHVFYGSHTDQYLMDGPTAIVPDGFSFRTGVTTMVDAGSAGWRNFPLFKSQVIDPSQTRILSFLNIVGEGMRGGNFEQNVHDIDPQKAAEAASQYKDFIVGFKVAHFAPATWDAVDSAVQAGTLAKRPVMVDFGGDDSHAPLSIEELFFKHLRTGDIYTHVFTELKRRDPIVDLTSRQLKPFLFDAQKKGIFFDVGFGGGSFDFRQAIPALKAGFYPNSISTDFHTGSMNAAMKDMLNLMSMFLAMGMDIQKVIGASTWNPAEEINHTELGHLSVGAIADIAVLTLRNGSFGFWDNAGYKINGKHRFECELTIKDGRVMYDLNGISKRVLLSQP